MRRSFLASLRIGLAFIASCSTVAFAADEATIINQPAEKYAIAPGGVDMRTGTYVYSETDLQIGPKDGGLALTRTSPVYVNGHVNPFGNFSHSWDIMLVERRIRISPPQEIGPDYRIMFHFGGRTFTFEGLENAVGFGYKSDGPTAYLTYTGGTKNSSTVAYTVRGPDGTSYLFRPMGGKDCGTTRRCAYVSKITQPDGTVLNFDYAYDAAATGNRARLTRITSSRGYVLMQEWTGNKVSKACVINAATEAPPAGTSCPTALAMATYAYDGEGRLTSATAPDNSVSQFTYAPISSLPVKFAMGFIKPGASSPWLTNKVWVRLDEEEMPQEITQEQNFADGRIFTYAYELSPFTTNKQPTLAGGTVTDAHGHQIKYEYDWPILPGSRQRVCQFPPCSLPMPDDIFKYTYQQTTGPVLVVDELGRETKFDYCDPIPWAGFPPQEIDRCIIVKHFNYFLPEGGTGPVSGSRPDNASGRVEYDSNGNVIKTTQYSKPGSTLPPIVTEALFGSGTFTQSKPLWRKDANSNQTDYTYDTAHGGLLTETSPAVSVNGTMVRPQKRFSYVQRYTWLKSGASYVQAATPVWLVASESFCRTSAATGNPATPCAAAGDEVLTTYDYGPNSGPNNLLLRGVVVTANNQSRRTCYGFDALGRKISETTPNANLTSCP